MCREEDLKPSLKALEAALARLVPRSDRLDRDRRMYEAGQESVRGGASASSSRARRAAWPAAFAAMTAAAGVLAVMLATRPAAEVVERIVYVPAETPGENATRCEAEPPPRPAPKGVSPGTPATPPAPAAVLATADWPGGWLALRRYPLDAEALDRLLAAPAPAARPPAAPDPRPVAAHSYRDLLRDLLKQQGANGS